MKQFLIAITLIFAALFGFSICADAAPLVMNKFVNTDISGLSMAFAGVGIATIAKPEIIDFSTIKSFTEQQFNDLKKQYGKVYLLTIEDEGELLHFAAIRPDRSVMAAIGDYAAKNDMNKVNDLMINNLIKLGDTNKLNDGVIYLTAIEQLAQIIEPVKSFLKRG